MDPCFHLPSKRCASTRLKNWLLICAYDELMKRHLELCYHVLEDPEVASQKIENYVRYHVLQECPDQVYVHINYKKGISKSKLRRRFGGLPILQMESISKPLSFWRYVDANVPGVSRSFGTLPDYSKPHVARFSRSRVSRPASPLTVPSVERTSISDVNSMEL